MQIITLRHQLCGLVLVLTLAISSYAVGQEHKSLLKYSKNSFTGETSVRLIAPNGVKYMLRLTPESDVGHHVVVLDVSLSRSNSKGGESNLLEPPGRWHGYQPYIFAASDFAPGIGGSQSQNTRTIDLPKLRMQIEIKVVGVNVEPTPPSPSSKGLTYDFTDLSLEITARSCPN